MALLRWPVGPLQLGFAAWTKTSRYATVYSAVSGVIKGGEMGTPLRFYAHKFSFIFGEKRIIIHSYNVLQSES